MGSPLKKAPTRRESFSKTSKIRKRCDNCGDLFPRTRTDRKFCSENCRKEFHRYGAAYGPIKQALEKLIDKRTREQVDARFVNLKEILLEINDRLEYLESKPK
jgi:hypothetical protein